MRKRKVGIPERHQLKQELEREQIKVRRRKMIGGMLEALIVASAVTILVSNLLVPVLQIDGSSMAPTLQEKEFVVSFRNKEIKRGDIIAFHNNNKVLVKRVIATEGETVDIDEEGIVYVDGGILKEEYLPKGTKSLGKCNINLPCRVPEGSVFVLGDNRKSSVDSRSVDIGCISQEQIVSKVTFRIWPLSGIGSVY